MPTSIGASRRSRRATYRRKLVRAGPGYLLTVQKSTPHTLLNVTPCTLERKAYGTAGWSSGA
jgi:hypothetical protein